MTDEELLTCALDVGERMVIWGGEIWRVEDSITRICASGGAERVDVFTITSSIVATVWMPARGALTQSRRILRRSTDLNRLEMLNELSRRICAGGMDAAAISRAVAEIDGQQKYPLWVEYLAFLLVSAAFSVFFGGSWRDAAASGAIGLALRFLDRRTGKAGLNSLVSNLICSAFCGALAIFAVRFRLADSVDKVMIGNIMPLIPGVALTNGIRDLFEGDLVSGLLRLCDALLLAVAIALGFVLSRAALGGLL